jgi:ribonuclease PH
MSEVSLTRVDGRKVNQLRPITFTPGWLDHPAGSCLAEFGQTRVLVTVSLLKQVPRWMIGQNRGWLTAEYQMIPGSSPERVDRESVRGKISGRTHEISRLIGRALRAVIDLKALPEVTLAIDAEVLQADGGTRTAAISAAYVALVNAIDRAKSTGDLPANVQLIDSVTAVSMGIVAGVAMLDLNYAEDSRADTDMNVVQLGDGSFIELQGTAEHGSFNHAELVDLLRLGSLGCVEIRQLQQAALSN